MPEKILPGLIQKALRDANDLKTTCQAQRGGQGYRLWKMTALGWSQVGELADGQDVEDFMVAQLTQEDR